MFPVSFHLFLVHANIQICSHANHSSSTQCPVGHPLPQKGHIEFYTHTTLMVHGLVTPSAHKAASNELYPFAPPLISLNTAQFWSSVNGFVCWHVTEFRRESEMPTFWIYRTSISVFKAVYEHSVFYWFIMKTSFSFFLMPFSGVGFFFCIYGSFRHLVGLHGWGISPAPRPVLTQDNTIQRNTDTHPCPEQDSNLQSQCTRGRRQYLP
jgi:hypothetical protein